jgi:hypothetical protein
VNKGIGLFAGITALLAMGSAGAACPSDPVYAATNEATGHVFEVYKAEGISWVDAAACADDTSIGGAVGHLATITSSSENLWVIDDLLIPSQTAATPLLKSQVWVGGYQEPGSTEPGDGWRWVNSEGPFSGTNNDPSMPGYTNWAAAEPNNSWGIENHLTVGRYPGNLYGWNDEGASLSSIGGFIVEYDVPRTAACTVVNGEPGTNCQTIDGQTLVFPTGSYTGGDTIKFTAFEFTDPRVVAGKCTTREPLNLFTDTAAFGSDAQLRIPAYLCGSPKFVVVKVNSEDLQILKGTVFVEHETTEKVLPDNLYKCFDPILGSSQTADPLYSPDPQYQDVVVWQSTDPTKMFEDLDGTGIYDGAATEATNGCGSTVAKVRGASYFVVGMHIDFGGGFDYADDPVGNYQQFVLLTQYKLSLLRKSVDLSRTYGSVKKPDWQAMSSQLKNAVNRLNAGDPAGALSSLQQFVFKVNSSTYSTATGTYAGFNFNGDHLMRGENILFMLRVKVVPYKPVP